MWGVDWSEAREEVVNRLRKEFSQVDRDAVLPGTGLVSEWKWNSAVGIS